MQFKNSVRGEDFLIINIKEQFLSSLLVIYQTLNEIPFFSQLYTKVMGNFHFPVGIGNNTNYKFTENAEENRM